MKPTIDCLFIGHNEMDFRQVEETVRKMGVDSGAYRDLDLNFIRYEDTPLSLSDCYNMLRPGGDLHLGETFNAAVAYLGTYLDRRGFTFDYVNSFQGRKEELAEKLLNNDVRAVAVITTLYVIALPIIEIVEFVRQYSPGVKIIVGGPFVSTQVRSLEANALEYLFGTIGADFYVNSSQGESTLVGILHALKTGSSLHTVNNIYYRSGSGYAAAPTVPESNRLAENMVNWGLFQNGVGEYVNVRTAVSCPFSCAFCGFPEHAGKYQTTPVEEVEKELNRLAEIPTVKSVHFIDDTFNVPPRRFKKILRMLNRNRYPFQWHSHFRCQYADEETVEMMKTGGCEGVFLGLESGSPRILKNMNKAATVEQYIKGIELLNKYEITTFASFIVGFPGETSETVKDTRRLIETGGIDFYRAQLWYCESVTPIRRQAGKYGIRGENFEWTHSGMDSKTAAQLVKEMFLTVNDPVWVPQYNFDFDNIFHLVHRGMSIPRVKEFLSAFNRGVRDKLSRPAGENMGVDVMKQLLTSLQLEDNCEAVLVEIENESPDNLDVDFDI